jgi:fatty acid desaturase
MGSIIDRSTTRGKFPRGYDGDLGTESSAQSVMSTCLPITIGTASADLLAALTLPMLSASILVQSGLSFVCILILPLLALATARAMRGSECLIHEASHYNWSRVRPANDLLANLLAAYPVFSRVDSYRATHLKHHAFLGDVLKDPDRERYASLRLEELDRSRARSIALGAWRRMPEYWSSWHRSAGSDRLALLCGGLLHVLTTLPFLIILPVEQVLLGRLIWAFDLAVVLPFVRLIAEAGEHKYTDRATVLNATISNIGPIHRLVFHPHNDGFHVVHHLWPRVPHFALRRLHNRLASSDPAFNGGNACHRIVRRVAKGGPSQRTSRIS